MWSFICKTKEFFIFLKYAVFIKNSLEDFIVMIRMVSKKYATNERAVAKIRVQLWTSTKTGGVLLRTIPKSNSNMRTARLFAADLFGTIRIATT